MKFNKETIRTWRAIGSIFIGGISFGILIGQMSEQYKNRVLRSHMDVLEENLENTKNEAEANYQVIRARIFDLNMEGVLNQKILTLATSAIGWMEAGDDVTALTRLKQIEGTLKRHITLFENKEHDFWTHDINGVSVRTKLW